jgi:putative component of toxin-antitoxin plasmid stabilization module
VIQRAGVASQLLRDAGPLLGDLSDALMVGQDVRTLMGPGWRVYTQVADQLPRIRMERIAE